MDILFCDCSCVWWLIDGFPSTPRLIDKERNRKRTWVKKRPSLSFYFNSFKKQTSNHNQTTNTIFNCFQFYPLVLIYYPSSSQTPQMKSVCVSLILFSSLFFFFASGNSQFFYVDYVEDAKLSLEDNNVSPSYSINGNLPPNSTLNLIRGYTCILFLFVYLCCLVYFLLSYQILYKLREKDAPSNSVYLFCWVIVVIVVVLIVCLDFLYSTLR